MITYELEEPNVGNVRIVLQEEQEQQLIFSMLLTTAAALMRFDMIPEIQQGEDDTRRYVLFFSNNTQRTRFYTWLSWYTVSHGIACIMSPGVLQQTDFAINGFLVRSVPLSATPDARRGRYIVRFHEGPQFSLPLDRNLATQLASFLFISGRPWSSERAYDTSEYEMIYTLRDPVTEPGDFFLRRLRLFLLEIRPAFRQLTGETEAIDHAFRVTADLHRQYAQAVPPLQTPGMDFVQDLNSDLANLTVPRRPEIATGAEAGPGTVYWYRVRRRTETRGRMGSLLIREGESLRNELLRRVSAAAQSLECAVDECEIAIAIENSDVGGGWQDYTAEIHAAWRASQTPTDSGILYAANAGGLNTVSTSNSPAAFAIDSLAGAVVDGSDMADSIRAAHQAMQQADASYRAAIDEQFRQTLRDVVDRNDAADLEPGMVRPENAPDPSRPPTYYFTGIGGAIFGGSSDAARLLAMDFDGDSPSRSVPVENPPIPTTNVANTSQPTIYPWVEGGRVTFLRESELQQAVLRADEVASTNRATLVVGQPSTSYTFQNTRGATDSSWSAGPPAPTGTGGPPTLGLSPLVTGMTTTRTQEQSYIRPGSLGQPIVIDNIRQRAQERPRYSTLQWQVIQTTLSDNYRPHGSVEYLAEIVLDAYLNKRLQLKDMWLSAKSSLDMQPRIAAICALFCGYASIRGYLRTHVCEPRHRLCAYFMWDMVRDLKAISGHIDKTPKLVAGTFDSEVSNFWKGTQPQPFTFKRGNVRMDTLLDQLCSSINNEWHRMNRHLEDSTECFWTANSLRPEPQKLELKERNTPRPRQILALETNHD